MNNEAMQATTRLVTRRPLPRVSRLSSSSKFSQFLDDTVQSGAGQAIQQGSGQTAVLGPQTPVAQPALIVHQSLEAVILYVNALLHASHHLNSYNPLQLWFHCERDA